MVMCIFLFLLWLILNGKVTLEICLFGVVITGAVYAFCVAALGCRPQTERRFLKRLGVDPRRPAQSRRPSHPRERRRAGQWWTFRCRRVPQVR